MKIKKCVGAVLYNDQGRIFLMTSPKWKWWVVPGGGIEEGETEEEALKREIMEELGIEIADLVRNSEKVKKPGNDFHDPEVEFHFVDFFARALGTEITPNEEVDEYGWYNIEEALELPLLDSTRDLVEEFVKYTNNKYSK